ncbi:acyltransferase [Arenimonas sp.]|uniref:LpxL/LpxP family acyltransferase n=1 Tax=Arenimonas sp. TaxID=1872635 RepID=UPI0039E2DF6B
MSAQHWAGIGESTFVSGIRFMVAVHRWFGRVPFRICLYPVIFWYWATKSLARRSSAEYLQRLQASRAVFSGTPGVALQLRHLFRFGETLLDKLLAMSGRYQVERLEFEGHEPMLAASAQGRGALLITAHMGCLELLQTAAEHREGLRITILVHTAHALRFNRILQRLNPDSPVRLVQVTDFSPVTVMMLADRIAAGEFVAIAGDRVPVHGDRTVRAPFLGQDAPLPIGPYLLASLLECPAYFISCLQERGSYRVRIEPMAERVVLPRASRETALRGYAAQFTAWMERRLEKAPLEWFNFFPFWDQDSHVRQHA